MRFIKLPLALLAICTATSFTNPKDSMVVTSPAFKNNDPIPIKYTCMGQEFSPPLSITNIPGNAKSLAIIVYDPSGIVRHASAPPAPPKSTKNKRNSKKHTTHITKESTLTKCDTPDNCYIYWMVWNIDVSDGNIPENFKNEDEGLNSSNAVGYKGLCPTSGTHYYHFKVYALDTKLNIDKKSSKAAVEKFMQGHVIATGELIGSFNKSYK